MKQSAVDQVRVWRERSRHESAFVIVPSYWFSVLSFATGLVAPLLERALLNQLHSLFVAVSPQPLSWAYLWRLFPSASAALIAANTMYGVTGIDSL